METKITKLLDSEKIPYKLLLHEKQVFTCEDAARERNVPLDEMIKCILLVDKGGRFVLACLTSEQMLEPNKVRELIKCQRLSFASDSQIQEILGYVKGAIPPCLPKEKIPIVFDKGISEKEKVNISSGNPLAGIELESRELIKLVNPIIGNISK